MFKLLFVLILSLNFIGCGKTEVYLYQNSDGIDSFINAEDGKAYINEQPKFFVLSNRPIKAKQKILPDGTIESEIDATNSNNIDKIFESTLPLVALKQA